MKLPDAATAVTDFIVASLAPTVATMMLLVETLLLVTTSEVELAAKFTEPTVLLIV